MLERAFLELEWSIQSGIGSLVDTACLTSKVYKKYSEALKGAGNNIIRIMS